MAGVMPGKKTVISAHAVMEVTPLERGMKDSEDMLTEGEWDDCA